MAKTTYLGGTLLFIFAVFLMFFYSVSALDDAIFIQENPVDIKQTCHNNGTLCSGSALCNITVFDPNEKVLADNQQMTQSATLAYFNYTLTANNTERVGTYCHEVTCTDINPSSSNFARECFKITSSGQAPSIADVLLYAVLLMAFVGIFILTLYGYFRLDWKRKTDVNGMFKLKWEKYTKLFLLLIVYVEILFMLFATWKSAETLIFLDFLSPLLYYFFIIWLVIAAPMMVFVFVLTYVFVFTDKKLQKAVVRGVPLR